MYTDVFVVGEFDDLPTPTLRKRVPIAVPVDEVVIDAPDAPESTPISTESVAASAAITPASSPIPDTDAIMNQAISPASTDHGCSLATSSPDLGFAPLPPIINFAYLRTANLSYLDDDCRADAVPLTPTDQPPTVDEPAVVETRYIASGLSTHPSPPAALITPASDTAIPTASADPVPSATLSLLSPARTSSIEPDNSLSGVLLSDLALSSFPPSRLADPAFDSALRTKHLALSSLACFRLIRPDNCLIFPAQDSPSSRKSHPAIFFPVNGLVENNVGNTDRHSFLSPFSGLLVLVAGGLNPRRIGGDELTFP